MRPIHRCVIFEAVGADMTHQRLQFRHVDNGAAAKRVQGIIDEHAVANVGGYHTVAVVRGHTRVTEGAGGVRPATTP